AQGTKLWVVDADKKVYVYSASGGFLGSWAPKDVGSPQGITTDGTDVWIVSSGDGKVRRYQGAASRASGSQSPANTYALSAANGSPSDVGTRGGLFWVTDGQDNEVYVYDVSDGAFRLLGHWGLDASNGDASGLTLDPSGASEDLWVVDRIDDAVYRYADGQSLRSGSQSAAETFTLAVANTHAEGIADPPVL